MCSLIHCHLNIRSGKLHRRTIDSINKWLLKSQETKARRQIALFWIAHKHKMIFPLFLTIPCLLNKNTQLIQRLLFQTGWLTQMQRSWESLTLNVVLESGSFPDQPVAPVTLVLSRIQPGRKGINSGVSWKKKETTVLIKSMRLI
jgi:hypothetical protein